MTFTRHVSLIALGAALLSGAAQAQQSLPTIEVGGAPLRSTTPRVRPAPAAAAGPSRAAPATAAPAAAAGPAIGAGSGAGPAQVSPVVVQYAVPAATYTLSSKELQQTRSFEFTNNLFRQTPGVSVNDVAGNPLQPQVDFRGFVASPIAGTPQGLAVYQNGIRINEAWGDNVYWDMIPNIAIDRSTVVTGNPLFGLNAIGGAVVLDMKNGFTYQGLEIDGRGGSRGRRQGVGQFGVQSGDYAAYLAMEALGDNGYRYFSGRQVKRLYGDVGYRGDSAEIHANVTLAGNKINGTGPAAVEDVASDPWSVYTTPQTQKNTLSMFDLNGNVQATPTWKLFGDMHYRAFDQARTDGNATDFSCETGDEFCFNERRRSRPPCPNFFNGQRSARRDRPHLDAFPHASAARCRRRMTMSISAFTTRSLLARASIRDGPYFAANEELGVMPPQPLRAPASTITSTNQPSGIAPVDRQRRQLLSRRLRARRAGCHRQADVTAGARFNRAGDQPLRSRAARR